MCVLIFTSFYLRVVIISLFGLNEQATAVSDHQRHGLLPCLANGEQRQKRFAGMFDGGINGHSGNICMRIALKSSGD
jgi:hypothetical protein